MTGATILLVEDHPTTRKLVRVTLGGAGYRVLEAESGAQALALATEAPDLVLLDLHLPDMSGFEVAERLRNASPGVSCPILAFSGYLPALEDGSVAAAGLAGFITKPVEPSRLLEIVRLHLPTPHAPADAGPVPVGVRVLVAEDDAIQRKLLVTRLTRLGYDVCEAVDGEAALELLRRLRVDAVVSDVLMPRRDGFELALAIRTTPELAHIPVVLVSAHAQEAADQRLAEVVGAHALIQRQAGYERIEDVLEASLRGGPRPCAPALVDELRTDYLHRVIRQLERQGAFNAHLAQQSSIQAAQLDILAGFAEVLTRTLDVDVLLDETLGRMLDALRFSRGAAYLRLDGRHLSPRAQRGLHAASARELEELFGLAPLLHQAMDTREALLLSADDPRGAAIFGAAPELWDDHRSFIITPFTSGQEVLGVCVIGCRRLEVGPEWRPFALAIGAQVGQAIAVARALSGLAESQRRAQGILDALPEGVVLVSRDEMVESGNHSANRLFSQEQATLTGRPLRVLVDRLRHQDGEPLAYEESATVRALRTGQPQSLVCRLEHPDRGDLAWLAVRATPLVNPGATEPYAAVTSYTDITEIRRLEEQLRQAQKMEAVGRLAGGIAHDFNNLLMVISSLSELGLGSVTPDSELAADLAEIRGAADRATTLTRQLLAFSRSKEVELCVFDVNGVVRDLERMLRRLIPGNIEFVIRLARDPLPVHADVGQLEQVLVNLVMNARDAMPAGGTVTTATTIVDLSEHTTALAGSAPGRYVQLTVHDTGIGMTESVRARLFEPFFTTKGPDRGSGLGLATAYGIVQSFGGAITVDSAPGQGACFRVLLPLAASDAADAAAKRSEHRSLHAPAPHGRTRHVG
jgi:signal transduction histidine kinase/CheY-like chemotaxis protein